MFKFNELEDIHLEITSNCQASCPMCIRNYHGGIENPLLKLSGWSIHDFKKIMTDEVLNQIKGFYFCGNFGDPIINDSLIEMIQYAVSINPDLNIRIHTNGSARNAKWWMHLAHALPRIHKVIFAIDGLEDTHSLYRIGTSYKKIIENAKAFIQAGGTAEWCFIKFKHNEHQIYEAKDRAEKLGFYLFTEKNTSRFFAKPEFDVYDKHGNVIYALEQPTNAITSYIPEHYAKNYADIFKNAEIDCYVKKTKECYIDAQRNVFPCCFLASAPYVYSPDNDITKNFRADVLEQYKDLRKTLGDTNSLNYSLKDIINSQEWQTAWKDYWGESKLLTCARTCGKIKNLSQPKDQFANTVGFRDE